MVKRWTEKEILWLIENYSQKGKTYCSNYLGRTEASIRQKAYMLGLYQNQNSEFFQDWQTRAANSKVGKKRPDQALVIKKLHDDGKLVKTEEQKKQVGIRTSKWIEENGHPKGMLGKKHTKETLEILSKASQDKWKNPDFRLNSEEYKQIQSDKMIVLRKQGKMRTGYSRGKQGKRKDLEDRYFRSSWEANYARYLNFLIKKNEIYKWEYEVDTFYFEEIKRGTRSYMPDFKIWESKDAEPYYIEIKGWMDDKSRIKLERMSKYYPDIKIILIQKKEYDSIKRKVKMLIDNWED